MTQHTALNLYRALTSSTSRRQHPRFDVAFPVEITVEGDAAMVPGLTMNVSQGGILVRTETPLPDRARCVVLFTRMRNLLHGERHDCPECGFVFPHLGVPMQSIWGRILRRGRGRGGYTAAIQFEQTLDVIQLGPAEGGDIESDRS